MKGIAAPNRLRRHRRTAAAVIAMAVLALLAAACSSGSSTGSGGSPNAGGASSSPSAVAYSSCMRSHGVPNFPDPQSNGQLPKTSAQQLGVSTSQLQAAQRACQPMLPTGGSFQQQAQQCFLTGDCPPALLQQILTAAGKFARCMRSHGVPNWPDPTIDSQGRPAFDVGNVGIDPHSPPIVDKEVECDRLTGGAVPTR